MNGHNGNNGNNGNKNQNGNGSNGHSVATKEFKLTHTPAAEETTVVPNSLNNPVFDQAVVLQQSPVWSRAIVWGIMGVTTSLVVWASLARFEEAIPAKGQLEPIGAVKEVQAPVPGVVKTMNVEDGKRVKQGEVLLTFDPTVSKSQLDSLNNIRNSLIQENQFYRAQMGQSSTDSLSASDISQFNFKPELVSLTKSRNALLAETQLYRAQLNGTTGRFLGADARQRLQSSLAEVNSRIASAESEISQLEKQLSQNRVQKSGTQGLLLVNQQIIKDIQSGANLKVNQLEKEISANRVKRSGTQEILKTNQRILDDIRPVVKAGGLSRIEVSRLEQQVSTYQNQIDVLDEEYGRLQYQKSEAGANSQVELMRQQQQINSRRTELDQLDEETARLQYAISGAREKLKNTVALSRKDLLTQISENEKRIAEIDGQLTKAIVENNKRIAEVDSQISQSKQTIQYQELRAPADGIVFDLKPNGPGFVANTSEPLLKIVPDDNLVAKVYITNQDIGFVKENMDVDVRVDSFPFSEFGDVKGKITWIGSDALPPDQINPYYRFPAKVRLEKQNLLINGREVKLQSGMSMTGNIKVRSRSVISIFTDLFTKKVESLKTVR